jgi:hypothetical protein
MTIVELIKNPPVAQGFIALAQLAATFGYVMMISTPPQITDAPGGQEFHESAD